MDIQHTHTHTNVKKEVKFLMMTSANLPAKMSSYANSFLRQQHYFFNKLLIIFIVIIINCIVGNLCAWQDNVRPKYFVQLGEFEIFFIFIFF